MSDRKSKSGSRQSPPRMDSRIVEAARDYENQKIIPHCVDCRRPCCKLTDVVLELSWQQTKKLYAINISQNEFDRKLKNGTGPEYIRQQQGLYYAYGSPCPAYDVKTRLCNVYGTATKPQSCSDFPVYLDVDVITADKRCEAVNIDELLTMMQAVAPDLKITAREDSEFPQLVAIRSKPRFRS